MNKKNKNFRIQGNKFLLTYPKKKGITRRSIRSSLNQSLEDINYLIISEEKSEEGYEHFHILLETNKKKNIKDQHKLDIKGVHGNYQSVRSFKKALKYVCKSGNTSGHGINVKEAILKTFSKPFDIFLYRCKHMGEDPVNLLITCKEQRKYSEESFTVHSDYLKNPSKYNKYIQENSNQYENPSQRLWIHKEKIAQLLGWSNQIIGTGIISKSLFFFGPSGIGKTTAVRELFGDNVHIIKHKDELKETLLRNPNAIIFDDMSFLKPETRESCLNITDAEVGSQVNVKNGMIKLDPLTPKAFISNKSPNEVFTSFDDAIERRLEVIHLENNSCAVSIYKSFEDIPESQKDNYVELHRSLFTFLIDFLKREKKKRQNRTSKTS